MAKNFITENGCVDETLILGSFDDIALANAYTHALAGGILSWPDKS